MQKQQTGRMVHAGEWVQEMLNAEHIDEVVEEYAMDAMTWS